MANDKWLEEIADKLQNHASEVNPNMWNAISSQVGSGASGAGAAGSAFSAGKVAAIVVGAASLTVASYFAFRTETVQPKENRSAQTTEQKTTQEPTATIVEESTVEKTNEPSVSEPIKTNTNKKLPTVAQQVDVSSQANNTIELKIKAVEPIRTITAKPVVEDVIVNTTKDKGPVAVGDQITETKSENNTNNITSKEKSYAIKKAPNVFSPNGDGVNEFFLVESEGLTNYSLVVLDRQNKTVWSTDNPNAKWDGLDMTGEKAPAGEYIYFIAADGPNGEKVAKYERLTIRR